jgi:hypothetical protein
VKDVEDRRWWIIAVANESGYFPTPEQAADIWVALTPETRAHYERNPRVATARDSNMHFAVLTRTIAGVMAGKIKPQQ